jgi:hypothetical protein
VIYPPLMPRPSLGRLLAGASLPVCHRPSLPAGARFFFASLFYLLRFPGRSLPFVPIPSVRPPAAADYPHHSGSTLALGLPEYRRNDRSSVPSATMARSRRRVRYPKMGLRRRTDARGGHERAGCTVRRALAAPQGGRGAYAGGVGREGRSYRQGYQRLGARQAAASVPTHHEIPR